MLLHDCILIPFPFDNENLHRTLQIPSPSGDVLEPLQGPGPAQPHPAPLPFSHRTACPLPGRSAARQSAACRRFCPTLSFFPPSVATSRSKSSSNAGSLPSTVFLTVNSANLGVFFSFQHHLSVSSCRHCIRMPPKKKFSFFLHL